MAPKITVFEGQTAQLLSATSRPFVTGYAVPGGQTPVPRTSIVQDGIFIETMAFAEHSKTHLSVACRLVGILDVGTRKLLMSSEEFTVQVPQITQTSVESKSIVAENESLVLIPLKREPKGLLTVFLITPKQLTIEPEENLLPLSTAGQQKSDDPSTEEE